MHDKNNCPECQHEEGHGLTCSKYVERKWVVPQQEDWEKELQDMLSFFAPTGKTREQLPNGTKVSPNHATIVNFVRQQREQVAEDFREARIPMGASQWRNHGEKFGYDLFFIEQAKEEGRREGQRCGKPVENGEAICGVVPDCHLHDWRQHEELEDYKEKLRERTKELPIGLLNGLEVVLLSAVLSIINETKQAYERQNVHVRLCDSNLCIHTVASTCNARRS